MSSGNSKQLRIDKALKKKLIHVFKKWMRSNNHPPNDYKVLDARFRLAGTGSVGIHRYVFLVEKIGSGKKHMLIDMKQATPSSLLPFVTVQQPKWESEAHRMVNIQCMMQNVPPAQLSTLYFEGQPYLMQEMQPTKDRINFRMIQDDFKTVCSVIEDMAMITASAHLRGVSRKGACTADELISFGEDNGWHAGLLEYATSYTQKVILDWKEFKGHLDPVERKRHKVQGTRNKEQGTRYKEQGTRYKS